MPSKRGWRALGAGLMEVGRQTHLNRAEQLEQQKADNLMALGEQRNSLMGEQNDIAREGQAQTAAYQERQQAFQAEQAAANNQFRIDSMNNDASLRELMVKGQQDSAAAQAAYHTAALGFQEKQITVVEAREKMANLRTFMTEDIPNTVNSYLNVDDLQKAALRESALTSVIEAGVMNLPPEQFDKYMENIEANLGTGGVDATKLEPAAFKKMLVALRTKKDLLAPELSMPQLLSLVQDREGVAKPEGPVEPETPPIPQLGKEYGLLSGQAGLKDWGTAMYGSKGGKWWEGTDPYGVHTAMGAYQKYIGQPFEALMYGADNIKKEE